MTASSSSTTSVSSPSSQQLARDSSWVRGRPCVVSSKAREPSCSTAASMEPEAAAPSTQGRGVQVRSITLGVRGGARPAAGPPLSRPWPSMSYTPHTWSSNRQASRACVGRGGAGTRSGWAGGAGRTHLTAPCPVAKQLKRPDGMSHTISCPSASPTTAVRPQAARQVTYICSGSSAGTRGGRTRLSACTLVPWMSRQPSRLPRRQ
ncbi:hypothetical protein V8C86DRAFT_2537142 [Haematococcus lacustris]